MNFSIKNLSTKLLIIVIFLLITIAVSPLRMIHIDVNLCSLIGFIVFFIATVISINKFKNKISPSTILFLALFGVIVLMLPDTIRYFKETIYSLLELIVHLIAIISGFYYTKLQNTKSKIIYSIVWVVIAIIFATIVNSLWIEYIVRPLQSA